MSRLPDPESGLELSVEAVRELAPMIESEILQFIDCREADEWAINRLPGARLVPLSGFGESALNLAAEGKPCVVYCHHGMRSLRATAMLRSLGLEAAWSMTGGIDAWADRIDPAVPKY